MRLKTLEIAGFKSFADRVKLTFSPGITTIVGPNGCGKSNIAEAFCWVLGEQSVKSLRSSRMSDVIFSGTVKRKPLVMAEVSITFTDTAGAFPLPYDELCVTRRLHKNGSSDYLINGQNVRLKDLQNLFMGSGLGKNALSIFEQGKMDQVIHYSPSERRLILEEVAGTSRLVQKRQEALKKLELLQVNLNRLYDILREVEQQLAISEKQAKEAEAYNALKLRLERLEKGRIRTKWRQIEQRHQESVAKLESKKEQLENALEALEAAKTSAEDDKIHFPELEALVDSAKESYFKVITAKKLCEQQLSSYREQKNGVLSKQTREEEELKACLEELEAITNVERELNVRFELLTSDAKAAKSCFEKSQDALDEVQEELYSLRSDHSKLREELVASVQKEKNFDHEIKRLILQCDNFSQRDQDLSERLQKQKEWLKELEEEKIAKQNAVAELIATSEEKELLLQSLEEKIEELTQQTRSLEEKTKKVKRELDLTEARQNILLQMREQHEGFSSGSKALIAEAKNSASPLFNKVALLSDILKVPAGKEKQVAIALKTYSQTLFVEDKKTLNQLLAFAKKESITNFSVICRELVEASSDIVDHFLKRISSCGNLEGLFSSSAKGQEKIAAEENFHLDSFGVLFHCSLGQESPFLRAAELTTLASSLESQQMQQQKLLRELEEKISYRKALEEEKKSCELLIRSSEMKLVEQNFALQRARNDASKILKEIETLSEEKKGLEDKQKEVAHELETKEKQYEIAKQKGSHSSFEMEQMSAYLEEKEALYKREKELFRRDEEKYRQTAELLKQNDHARQMAKLKKEQLEHMQERHNKAQQLGNEQLTLFCSKEKELEEQHKSYVKELYQRQTCYEELEQKLSNLKNSFSSAQLKLQKWQDNVKLLEREAHQLQLLLTQCEAAKTSLQEETLARFSQEAIFEESCCEMLSSLVAYEREIPLLQKQLENMGNINLAAIDECKQHKERHTILCAQLSDLDLGKKELEEIIAQLEEESRQIFAATFDKVRESFQKNFQILFNGGEADLTLEGSTDLLDCGIGISAKPPGKQMRSIQLLSGGEKCLTAMALLFAIFEVKPAPFCILDEIDAPLDDANVERFGKVVKQFIDRSQFIVITHNKRTMALADILFGVSMEEKGVSKVLSMNFGGSDASNKEKTLSAVAVH